jgi:uncharacterized protein (TIGR03435 family)
MEEPRLDQTASDVQAQLTRFDVFFHVGSAHAAREGAALISTVVDRSPERVIPVSNATRIDAREAADDAVTSKASMRFSSRHVAHRAAAAVAVVALCSAATVVAQGPRFDAVSIKRHVGAQLFGGNFEPSGPGRFRATGISIIQIITAAWDVPMGIGFGIKGMPSWASQENYDFAIVWPPETSREDLREMWRAMFAERFKLATHYEEIDDPSYALTVARTDGRLGPELKRSTLDCDAIDAEQRAGTPAPLLPNGAGPCAMKMSGDGFISGGVTMKQLAPTLTGPAGRQVVDRTGLDGRWEFVLHFSREERDPNAPLGQYPSLQAALRDQLGLKLVPFVAKNKLLVIDHIERPTEN